MEIRKEKSFPRGGKKPALFKSKKNSNFSLFRKPKAKLPKKNKHTDNGKEKEKKTKQSKTAFSVKHVDDLRPTVIQDGMLLLGMVSQTTEKIVNISLPGGLRGVLTLASISDFYKNMIENETEDSQAPALREIFQVGDILPVKVLSASEEHPSLMLTSEPKLINEKLSYDLIEPGFILVGSVKSREDHGFIIDFGVDHVNAFLNYEKVEKERDLVVGQLVRCSVIKCNTSPGCCSVQLSNLKNDLQTSVIKKNSVLPLYSFIPGFQFEVTVNRILNGGVEVSYRDGSNSKAYIHEDYFLKKFSNPSDLEIGATYIATLLYVKPLVNFLYFKIMPKKQDEFPFKYGDIVSGKVVNVRRTGVIFKIIQGSLKAKCFVPLSKLKGVDGLPEDKTEIVNQYPVNKRVSKIRLGKIDYMGRYYIGATDRASISAKYYSISDLKCGEIVSCKINAIGKSSARLEIAKTITGVVGFSDMTDIPLRNPALKFKVGQKVKARIMELSLETRFIRLTMKPTLLKEKDILCDINDCKKNKQYIGTVFKVLHSKVIVKFFNSISGVIPKHLTPYPDCNSLTDHFYKGELVKCSVISVERDNKLALSLLLNDSDYQLELGKKYKVVVINKTDSGLFLDVHIDKSTKCKGLLPAVLLSAHHSLGPALQSTYSKGDKLFAYCLSNDIKHGAPIFGAEEVFHDLYEGKSKEDLEKLLTVDSILPFLFRHKNQKTKCILLQTIISGEDSSTARVKNDEALLSYPLSKFQILYGKILGIGKKAIYVSTKLTDVWDKNFQSSLGFLDSYLKGMSDLVSRQKSKLNSYNENIRLGCSVRGVIQEVRTNHAILRTEDGDLGIIQGKFTEGQEVTGKVVWIDGPEQMIYIIPEVHSPVESPARRPLVPENDNVRGKIVFINQELAVVELKGRGKGNLAYLPRRRHLNDLSNNECVFEVGDELKLWITRKNSNHLLAMDRRIVFLQEKIIWKNAENKLKESVNSLKRKLESEKIERLKRRRSESETEDVQVIDVKIKNANKNGEEELPEVKEEIDIDEELSNWTSNGVPKLEYDDVDIKTEDEENENGSPKPLLRINNDERIPLSSSSESEGEEECTNEKLDSSKAFKVGFNWEVLNNQSLLSGVLLKNDEPSSDEEDDESKYDKKKRRRLTAIEKREKAKSEEERLRSIEERLMDGEREPETADDFDRAVLANPDSSATWLKYMAFHVQATEIEKARAVAKRALKSISFREEQEKLNIWIALLNLENMYGNEDSLNKTLNEALQLNDPYKIHLHMLKLHGNGNKFQEMEKLGAFMMKKYKDLENMWIDLAAAYFSVGKIESARNVLQKALTIVEKNQHVPLISKFAQLENKYGTPERAQTLYESILASFPKRVDIWSCYVDMLTKSNQIDLARQVLERATSQSLRPRKMKTLFKKFIAFEEAHGTQEDVEKVRQAAVEYVETFGGAGD